MRCSITFWSFSVALITIILALCCQLIESTRPSNPESANDCVPIKNVYKRKYGTVNPTWWDERVFVCEIEEGRFEIYSYAKSQTIVIFDSDDMVFTRTSGLSIWLSVQEQTNSASAILRCAFAEIGHITKFYTSAQPSSLFSPRNIRLSELESCLVMQGECIQRKTLSSDSLVFQQKFLSPQSAIFSFEPENSEQEGDSFLTFLPHEFQVVKMTNTKTVLVCSAARQFYYNLDFSNQQFNDDFNAYIAEFVDVSFGLTITDGL